MAVSLQIYLELNQRYPERSGVYLEAWARILERVCELSFGGNINASA